MPRTQLAYEVGDVSAAAKSLRAQLQKLERLPSHVELLNMLARAAGFRNFQHFRADILARTPSPGADDPSVDRARVEKAAHHFDPEGRLLRWPARESQAILCLWVLWSRLPGGASFTEIEISELLEGWHSFGDRALLRRALVDYGLVSRTVDGRKYVRVSQKPPAELGPLLRLVGTKG
jgi:hypothetical protein